MYYVGYVDLYGGMRYFDLEITDVGANDCDNSNNRESFWAEHGEYGWVVDEC